MSRVLVLYPQELLSSTNFQRKVGNIVSQLNELTLLYINDYHGFVKQFAIESNGSVKSEQVSSCEDSSITHVIVFDDGEEFTQEVVEIQSRKIPIRRLKIYITRVINIKKNKKYEGLKSTEDYEYIGRGSYWGNPYSMYEANDEGSIDGREEVIRKFKYDFDFDLFPNKDKKELLKLRGKRLGCFCKPEACHGDVLAEYLNSLDDE